MPDVFQFLASEDSVIETGIVDTYLGNNRYRVISGGTSRILRSAVNEKLESGSRVVINRTRNDRYIIGATNQLQTRTQNEIVVKG